MYRSFPLSKSAVGPVSPVTTSIATGFGSVMSILETFSPSYSEIYMSLPIRRISSGVESPVITSVKVGFISVISILHTLSP